MSSMKRRDLERKLKQLGWWKDREGSSHSIWTNGTIKEPVPRHNEIKEMLAKKIIGSAENNPPEEWK